MNESCRDAFIHWQAASAPFSTRSYTVSQHKTASGICGIFIHVGGNSDRRGDERGDGGQAFCSTKVRNTQVIHIHPELWDWRLPFLFQKEEVRPQKAGAAVR